MSRRQIVSVISVTLVMTAALALPGCGQSSPSGVGTASNADHYEGDGHDHAMDIAAAHDHSSWWCVEHGVPEGECSRCNSKLAANFQKDGDWCKEHDRAQSQCFICDPRLKEKYVAIFKAKYGENPPPIVD